MKSRDHMNLCEQTTWSGSSTSHLTDRLRKRASGILEWAGADGDRGPLGQEYLSSYFIPDRHFTSFLSHTSQTDTKKASTCSHGPRGLCRGLEERAVLWRLLQLEEELFWYHPSIARYQLQACRKERERGRLQRQLRALSRLKPEGRLRSQWRVLGNHKAGRNYSERKISEDEQGQSTSCKQVLSKVPFQVGSSEFRTFFSPVQMKASTNGHQ